MANISIDLELKPSEVDNSVLRKGIIDFNVAHLGEKAVNCSVFARDENNKVIGGATLWVHSDAAYIDILWVEESFRQQRVGSGIMRVVDEYARQQKLAAVFVDTFDFQALDFYLKQGYQLIAEIKAYLLKHDRYYLRKDF
ncbi:N-acetylglutamate synthase [Legionella birminghamensis]|uniref:Acetyltransferase n=1 Tax=Legionella birminghamensis TaxID=28083 RepID=A0A378ICD5_9GAMM|nr:GNAT family N-acetyltransferase [Legionella birminghamensis]KTC71671.1 N-acetylglutamate synthase [Legionella birminghamensis]STX32490.1 acetyltransferase [Legionella birminghamensis]